MAYIKAADFYMLILYSAFLPKEDLRDLFSFGGLFRVFQNFCHEGM
jgi:hypothetical protein